MKQKTRTKVLISFVVTALFLLAVKLLLVQQPGSVTATEPPESIRLNGSLRDFTSSHPDFGCSDSASYGHAAHNVSSTLSNYRPEYLGSGRAIKDQWFDKDGNPIMPYIAATDPGLPGGHFDVDVFDEATTNELYHEHEFDDKFDVTYVDVAHDPKLLFDSVIGSDYPNNLRLSFVNPHHGSGIYTFEAGGILQAGNTKDGFETVFDPGELTQLRIDFAYLNDLRGTNPSTVQNDIVDRDDSLSLRMYDVTTDNLVYELAVYHHIKKGETEDTGGGGVIAGVDSCGVPILDAIGTYDGTNSGAVMDAGTFGQWFRDVLGVNLSKQHTIELWRNSDGIYEYLTDAYYPADDALLGNEGLSHNNHFTYTVSATFTYQSCTGQFFEFEGNDDAWVFIDNKLVIDLGGLATPDRQYVSLDRLNLVDGQVYSLNFFYAQRCNAIDSIFRMRTNILLETAGSVQVSGSYD